MVQSAQCGVQQRFVISFSLCATNQCAAPLASCFEICRILYGSVGSLNLLNCQGFCESVDCVDCQCQNSDYDAALACGCRHGKPWAPADLAGTESETKCCRHGKTDVVKHTIPTSHRAHANSDKNVQ